MTTTITLTGYLGRDREIRDTKAPTYTVKRWNEIAETTDEYDVTPPSRSYALLSLATHEGRNGSRRTTWHRLIAWNVDRMDRRSVRLARKGDLVRVTGRRETFSFTDDDGQEREVQQVIVDDLVFLRKKAREIP